MCVFTLWLNPWVLCWARSLSGAQLQPLSDFWRLGTWKTGLSHGHLKAQVLVIEPKRVLWCSLKGSIADAQAVLLKWTELSAIIAWLGKDICGFNWNLLFQIFPFKFYDFENKNSSSYLQWNLSLFYLVATGKTQNHLLFFLKIMGNCIIIVIMAVAHIKTCGVFKFFEMHRIITLTPSGLW